MKKNVIKQAFYIGALALLFLPVSCGKEFLNLKPIEDLSGNNYWQREDDVLQNMNSIYNTFREATMRQIFFPASGDMRCAPINRTPASNNAGRDYLAYVRDNNLNATINGNRFPYFGFVQLTKWDRFFKMVQVANILSFEVDRMENLSRQKKDTYIAEAVFLRNLAYFFMVRMYGDVPYYTEAYHSSPLRRTNMLTVLHACIADMEAHYRNLPWTYDDPSIVAVRAMRGAAITLMMHMNMWVAGFTDGDNAPYYERTAELGREIMEENGGAYELLPLDRTGEIFGGRSREGLLEIVSNINFGETFHLSAPFSDYVLHYPNKVTTRSYIYYDRRFMEKLYPRIGQDRRKEVWFDEYIYDTNGMMQMLKFANVFMEEGEDFNPDDNNMVFRYADPILLRAEALAELGRDDEARTMVNVIRERADATPAVTEAGNELKDFIWWERVRELMGEGHFFYDMVRTGKVVNSDYTSRPMSVLAFRSGGWTWPIHTDALKNNPFMTLNNYWN